MKPSGRFVVRVTPETHALLKQEGLRRGLSLNELCKERLGEPFNEREIPIPGEGHLKISDLLNAAKQMGLSVLSIVLFGSFSRGEQRPSSDLDLLFVLPEVQPIDRSLYLKWDEAMSPWRTKLSREISVHFVHLPKDVSQSGSLWLECALDGRILLDESGGKTEKALSEIRRLIAEGRWRRQYAYGQPYWIGATNDK